MKHTLSQLPLVLTARQIEYLRDNNLEEIGGAGPDGAVIISFDGDGWILVGQWHADQSPDEAANVEGTGVWVDPEGKEHHG